MKRYKKINIFRPVAGEQRKFSKFQLAIDEEYQQYPVKIFITQTWSFFSFIFFSSLEALLSKQEKKILDFPTDLWSF